ncbi:MAG TPA: aldo/keto reductase [Terrimicrobiaceae bacterium]
MTPVEEVMRGLDDMVRAGKVLYVGIADTPAWIVSQANTLAQVHGWSPFVGLQVEYSLAQREPERDLLPMARAFDIGLTACSPLAGGILSGKYAKGTKTNSDTARYGPHPRWQRGVVRGSDRQSAIRPWPLEDTCRHARRPATEGRLKVEVR